MLVMEMRQRVSHRLTKQYMSRGEQDDEADAVSEAADQGQMQHIMNSCWVYQTCLKYAKQICAQKCN